MKTMLKTPWMIIGIVVALGMMAFGGFGWQKERARERQVISALVHLRGAIEQGQSATISVAQSVVEIYDAGKMPSKLRGLAPARVEIEALTLFPNITEPEWKGRYDEWKEEAESASLRIQEKSRGVGAKIDAMLTLLR